MRYSLLLPGLLSLALCMIGCNGNPAYSNLDPIEDDYTAELTVQRIMSGVIEDNVLGNLENGTFTDEVVTGLSGTATVDGYESYTQSSCGDFCTEREYNAEVTIVFSNFTVNSASNAVTTISGTIYYKDYDYSRQSGVSSYSSSRSYTIRSTSTIQYRMTADNEWGYEDILTFSASGSNPYQPSGSMRTNSGTYFFN